MTPTHLVSLLEHGAAVTNVTFSPDGRLLATSGKDDSARLWDVATWSQLKRLHHVSLPKVIDTVSFSADGQRLATVCAEWHRLWVWDVASGCPRIDTYLLWDPNKLAFNQELTRLAFGRHWTVKILDLTQGKLLPDFQLEEEGLTALAFSSDGTRVATLSHEQKRVQVWDVATGKALSRHDSPESLTRLLFTPDGQHLLLTGFSDLSIRIWEVATQSELQQLRLGHTDTAAKEHAVVLSADGKRLASPGQVWDLLEGQERLNLTERLLSFDVVALSADGILVAMGSSYKTVKVWEVKTGREMASLTHDTWLTSLAFSPDGQFLVAGGRDHLAPVWSVTGDVKAVPSSTRSARQDTAKSSGSQ